jgi:hypothetical protein
MNTDKLKAYWNDNPLGVIGVAAAVVTATAKLLDTVSAAQGRRAYAKQVNYRINKKK